MKKWTLYHGTGIAQAKKILREGLKPTKTHPIYLTPDKKVAKMFAISERNFVDSIYKETTSRKPIILKVIITEKDFDNQLKHGVNKRIVEMRKNNLDRAIKDKWFEYEWYYKIPPERIKIEGS